MRLCVAAGDPGPERLRLQLVLPDPSFLPQQHRLQEKQHVQVHPIRTMCCLFIRICLMCWVTCVVNGGLYSCWMCPNVHILDFNPPKEWTIKGSWPHHHHHAADLSLTVNMQCVSCQLLSFCSWQICSSQASYSQIRSRAVKDHSLTAVSPHENQNPHIWKSEGGSLNLFMNVDTFYVKK